MSQLPPLTPLTRQALRGLKAQKDEQLRAEQEKQRLYQVSRTVYQIYGDARASAEIRGATSYKFHVNNSITLQDIPDILAGLQTLFPDSSVEHSLLVKGNDGNMYDVSNMDEKMRPFINTQQGQQYIVIDWS
jgi:hypothetical protein